MTNTPAPHRATPQQWAEQEIWFKSNPNASCLLELRDRLAAAEQRIGELEGTCRPVIHGNGATHPLTLAAGCRHEANNYPDDSPLRILLSDAAETLEILAPAAGPRVTEQRISEQEGNSSAGLADSTPAANPQELSNDEAYKLWDVDDSSGVPDTVRRIYRAGWDAAMATATCPHIRSSDEGTSYCALGEATAAASPPDHSHLAPEMVPAGLLVEVMAKIIAVTEGQGGLWKPEARARAVILAVAGWLDDGCRDSCVGIRNTAARWLREEVERHG